MSAFTAGGAGGFSLFNSAWAVTLSSGLLESSAIIASSSAILAVLSAFSSDWPAAEVSAAAETLELD